jgi:hypothetical protein
MVGLARFRTPTYGLGNRWGETISHRQRSSQGRCFRSLTVSVFSATYTSPRSSDALIAAGKADPGDRVLQDGNGVCGSGESESDQLAIGSQALAVGLGVGRPESAVTSLAGFGRLRGCFKGGFLRMKAGERRSDRFSYAKVGGRPLASFDTPRRRSGDWPVLRLPAVPRRPRSHRDPGRLQVQRLAVSRRTPACCMRRSVQPSRPKGNNMLFLFVTQDTGHVDGGCKPSRRSQCPGDRLRCRFSGDHQWPVLGDR